MGNSELSDNGNFFFLLIFYFLYLSWKLRSLALKTVHISMDNTKSSRRQVGNYGKK